MDLIDLPAEITMYSKNSYVHCLYAFSDLRRITRTFCEHNMHNKIMDFDLLFLAMKLLKNGFGDY